MEDFVTFDITKYIKAEAPQEGPRSVMPEQFCGLIVGMPNSGKTTLATAMLKAPHCLYKKFDLTLFISPYKIESLPVKKDRWNKTLSLSWIKDRIAFFKKQRDIKKVFIFIDDQVHHIGKGSHQQDITELFYNRRKLVEGTEISLLCSTQKYTKFPSAFRSACDFIILFNVNNTDLKVIANENVTNIKTFETIAQAHWSCKPETKPFLYIRKTPFYKLFLNFEETA